MEAYQLPKGVQQSKCGHPRCAKGNPGLLRSQVQDQRPAPLEDSDRSLIKMEFSPEERLKLARAEVALMKSQVEDYQTNLTLNKESLKLFIQGLQGEGSQMVQTINGLVEENLNLQTALFKQQKQMPGILRDLLSEQKRPVAKDQGTQTEEEQNDPQMENGYLKENNELLK